MITFLHMLLSKLTYGERLKPERDWFVLLWISAGLLVASIGWNAWLYHQIESGAVIGNSTVKPAAVFNKTSVTNVQNIFTDRASEEARYTTGAYNFIDPSK